MYKVLVLVDLQNDFIDGVLGTPEAQAIVPRVIEKVENFPDKENTRIFFTKDTHGKSYLDTLEGQHLLVEHCKKNTYGWNINEQIMEVVNKYEKEYDFDYAFNVIEKSTFGSNSLKEFFYEAANEISEVHICGLCTDVCVISNALMARQALPNTRIVVDASCCAGTTPEKHKVALEVMKSCCIDVENENLPIKMSLKEFAKMLDDREYGCPQFTKEEIQIAKDNGFVIVYGSSDDLMEFDGVISDECGCFKDGIFWIDRVHDKYIESVWCDKNSRDEYGQVIPWTYKTDIPHETFMIYNDGDSYCRGIVFDIENI